MFVIVWPSQLTKFLLYVSLYIYTVDSKNYNEADFGYMLVYIYTVDSKNYNEADFGILAEELLFWMSRR